MTYPVVCFSSIFQMLAKFAEDDRLEQMNAQRRRMRQLEHKRAVEKLIEERKAMLHRDKVVALTLAKILVSRVKPPKIIYSVLPHYSNYSYPLKFAIVYSPQSSDICQNVREGFAIFGIRMYYELLL